MDNDKRIGLVTGASRGLGLELIKEGLTRGYTMVAGRLASDAVEDEALLTLKSVYGQQLELLVMDVTSCESVQASVEAFKAKYDHLDFVVNNAGVLFESKFDEHDAMAEMNIEMLRKTLEVNTIGPARVLKYYAPFIYAGTKSTLITISSEAGHLTPGGYRYLAYSVSKHAVNMYTQQIRNYLVSEKESLGIRVFMVHPGRMQTVMGKENAQISPTVPAKGILDLVDGVIDPVLDIPFVDYEGRQMPY